MFTPYEPCANCKRKELCEKCAYKALQINYQKALNEVIKLSAELGKQITIIQ